MALEKTITYDRITRDYRMELDGHFIGYARNPREADMTLNQTAYEWLTHGYIATATELDGGADNEEGDPGNDCPEHGPYADDDCPKCGARRMPEGDYLTPDGMRISKHNNTNNLVTAA